MKPVNQIQYKTHFCPIQNRLIFHVQRAQLIIHILSHKSTGYYCIYSNWPKDSLQIQLKWNSFVTFLIAWNEWVSQQFSNYLSTFLKFFTFLFQTRMLFSFLSFPNANLSVSFLPHFDHIFEIIAKHVHGV